MKSRINLWKKAKHIYEDIHQMKKVSELIDYIPVQSIENVATLLLIIWVLSPIIVMFSNCSIQDVGELDFMFKEIAISTSWYEILQTIGFLGCILNIIVFSKSIINAKTEKICVSEYLKSNLFTMFLLFLVVDKSYTRSEGDFVLKF